MPQPRVSIITAVYNPPRAAFEDTVASVLGQTYSDWEWVLADDCSSDEWVRPRLRELAAGDSRIKVIERVENGRIVAASNSALAGAGGEFIALLDHDDVLHVEALAKSLAAIDAHQADGAEVDYCYSDQDKMSEDGILHEPYLKPDWSPERLRHHMYTAHFSLLRRSLVNEVGGFRPGFDGSQDHDLVLRVTERARGIVHVPEVLYHWRNVEGSAAGDLEAKPYAWDAGVRAVQDHLDRMGVRATAGRGRIPGLYQIDREPDRTTPVSVIIPTIGTRAMVFGRIRTLVTETVRSILERTQHESVEFVIVYDTPTPPDVLSDLTAVGREFGVRVRLIEFRKPFNYSAKCNVGAFHASGEVLLFLNDDMEAVSGGVIETLLAPLDEPGVGMTGAKLLFENGLIQHGGVVYGAGTIHHSYYQDPADSIGVFGELTINRETTALTGACIAVRREVFDEVGGFTETLPLNFNDVDFCFKVRRSGRRLIWLHDVVLYHFESITREPVVLKSERRMMIDRWDNFHVIPERYSNEMRWNSPTR